ncbi:MAG: protein kinase domain-containing protein [Deltaproteobacteria bacterium]
MSRKLTAGSSLAQYRIVRLLGEGGMGAVYEALDESLDRHVAIKTLLSDVAQDPESRKRFFREGKAAARLRHPHVVEVYGVGIENEIPYLVMELLDGESLAATLDRDKSLAPERAIETLLPVLSALVTAHQEGVIHRDLKPDNLVLQKTRAQTVVPKLLDFGISKVTGAQNSRITHTSALMGTPYYMSPEQARGSKDVDARIDQWAMGVILYEALAGERPVQGESVLEILHRIAMMPIRPLAVPGVPPELASVVMRALERDPARRWPSIAALGHALLPFASAGTRSSWAAAFACGTPDSMLLEEAASEREVAATVTGPSSPREVLSGTPTVVGPRARSQTPPGEPRLSPLPALPASPSTDTPAPTPPVRSATPWVAGGALVVMVMLGLVASSLVGSSVVAPAPEPPSRAEARLAPLPAAADPPPPPPPPTAYRAELRVRPESATIALDGVEIATGTWSATLPLDGRAHHLVVRAEGYEPAEVSFTDAPPRSELELARSPRASPARTGIRRGEARAETPPRATSGPQVGANGSCILQ